MIEPSTIRGAVFYYARIFCFCVAIFAALAALVVVYFGLTYGWTETLRIASLDAGDWLRKAEIAAGLCVAGGVLGQVLDAIWKRLFGGK